MSQPPRALPAPPGDVVVVTETLAELALRASRESPRQRMILPFHKGHEDPLHRMFNAMQPGTYVRPHRHLSTPRAEVFLALKGCAEVVIFHDDGSIRESHVLRAGSHELGVDLGPGLFHTFVVWEMDTLLYELKLGPYVEAGAKDFAAWAPAEGASDAPAYLSALREELARRRPSV